MLKMAYFYGFPLFFLARPLLRKKERETKRGRKETPSACLPSKTRENKCFWYQGIVLWASIAFELKHFCMIKGDFYCP